MYICVYIYVYVYIYMYICVCIYIYIYIKRTPSIQFHDPSLGKVIFYHKPLDLNVEGK